ncbi:hypothetical protein PRUPE_7G177600 [Prunus persica]|uniref:GDSL esterase/lipase n=1 Tax=Prunus persica TaxID=3760 RepID=A0A251NFX6_PRUPE|nr:hypothetical protein PRUPE_7G177600 [Prunus persica]
MAKGLRSVFSVWLIVLYLGMLGLHECYQPRVPGVYIFGDSTVDVGTNHYLTESECRSRADFLYNGIDFPHSIPTGRFSNGFNIVDYIAIFLGFKMSPPPFLSLLDKNKQLPKRMIRLLSRGVNFASGGSGILDDTGKQWGKVIPFGEQVEQFAIVRNKISELLGEEGAAANISESLFLISVGSNDILEHFAYNQSGQAYITTLMSTYESRLRNLFDIGAKKFGIISVAPIGCIPLIHSVTQTRDCFGPMNEHAQLFYKALHDMLLKLSSECKGMMYALADAYNMTTPILENPQKFGFNEVTKACCGKGNFNAEEPCTPNAKVCKYHNEYLFWDQYHPTQAASYLAALAVFGNHEFVVPITFGQLVSP